MEETNTAIEIRPAREDADEIAAMARALSVSDGDRISRFSAEAFLRDGFGDIPAFDTMVATGMTSPQDTPCTTGVTIPTAQPGACTWPIYVDERYRRDGVGTALVTRSRAIAEMPAGAGYSGRC